MTDLPRHFIVADLGFGDAGKGATVDRLCRWQPVHTVVRYNGGCQAGHNVHLPDGREHTFSQFGSGTFAGAQTFLSRHMMVEPYSLAIEAEALRNVGVSNPLNLVTIEETALLTCPYHWIVNRAMEQMRGGGKHGSCGRGVGLTRQYALENPRWPVRADDYRTPRRHQEKLDEMYRWCKQTVTNMHLPQQPYIPGPKEVADRQAEVLAQVDFDHGIVNNLYLPDLLRNDQATVFEGAQGMLIDESWGFHPHTTWSDVSMRNADDLLAEAGVRGYRMGVLRTYMVRHGAGPLPTQAKLDIPETDNPTNTWQETMRQGWFDAPLYRYSMAAMSAASGQAYVITDGDIPYTSYLDGLCLTHVDVAMENDLRVVSQYRLDGKPWELPFTGEQQPLDYQESLGREIMRADWVLGDRVLNWQQTVQDALGMPVVMTGQGNTHEGYVPSSQFPLTVPDDLRNDSFMSTPILS